MCSGPVAEHLRGAAALRAGRRRTGRPAGLNDLAAVQDDLVGDRAGEAHLVGDDEHGHARGRQVSADVEDLVNISGRGWWGLPEHELGVHRQRFGQWRRVAADPESETLVGLVLQADSGQQLTGPLSARPGDAHSLMGARVMLSRPCGAEEAS